MIYQALTSHHGKSTLGFTSHICHAGGHTLQLQAVVTFLTNIPSSDYRHVDLFTSVHPQCNLAFSNCPFLPVCLTLSSFSFTLTWRLKLLFLPFIASHYLFYISFCSHTVTLSVLLIPVCLSQSLFAFFLSLSLSVCVYLPTYVEDALFYNVHQDTVIIFYVRSYLLAHQFLHVLWRDALWLTNLHC